MPKRYLFTALAWAVAGCLLSLVIRLQPGTRVSYDTVATLHGTIMIFFVLGGGLIGALGSAGCTGGYEPGAPMGLNAACTAERAGALDRIAYWIYVLAGVVMLGAIVLEIRPSRAGWSTYPPLSIVPEALHSADSLRLWIASMVLVMVWLSIMSIRLITTIVTRGTTGLSFTDMPLNVWAYLCTATLALLSSPMLLAVLILFLLDSVTGTPFYLSDIYIQGEQLPAGGSPVLYKSLFWFVGHPGMYLAMIPALGIVSELLATHTGKPRFGYTTVVITLCVITLTVCWVWSNHVVTTGMNIFLGSASTLTLVLIALPAAILVLTWIATLVQGRIHWTPAMCFATGAIVLLIIGATTGLYLHAPTTDVGLSDTYYGVALLHLIMGGGATFGLLAGVYHWAPDLCGGPLNTTLGYIHFWITLPGTLFTFFPMYYQGIGGMSRRYQSYTNFEDFHHLDPLTPLINTAAIITLIAQLIFLYNLFTSTVRRHASQRNP